MDLDGPTARLRPVNAPARAAWAPDDDADAETAPLPVVHARDTDGDGSRPGGDGDVASPARSRPLRSGGDDLPPRGSRWRRSAVLLVAVGVLLAAVLGGGLYLFSTLGSAPDFEGPGDGDVIVAVSEGDSTAQIGRTLEGAGVVASVAAFLDAAAEDERILTVQPGTYQMRLRMSAAAAVARLLDPAARVGQLEIRGGVQLDDTSGPDGSVAPGALSLISQATCATIDGAESCIGVEELRATMAETDPAELGVPEWALERVRAADPVRRLEGLFAPGLYDIEPGQSAADVLRALLATSETRLEATGLVSGARDIGSSPYEVLVIASLVEKEGITADMPEVARVIYNRLGVGQRLELDSTVNYPLDLQALATTDTDRSTPGPYNTYRTAGLPPTPIAAAGEAAIGAALAPEPGPWFYFVRCRPDGTSCFAETFEEHTANVALARENGAF
ncbi:endolytic transglycosylase MltG [Pseudonocardia sp.]|uniref:endolytic transglycosylase MltG n=1 Tax=Pseudonocardia sp. TaxID=60912 RepID=UPI0026207AB0|nr:endolytic transglycosylase MltG [Pseudonocardia sp.]